MRSNNSLFNTNNQAATTYTPYELNQYALRYESDLFKAKEFSEQSNLLKNIKTVAIKGSDYAQEVYLRLDRFFENPALAALIVKNIKEIAQATGQARFHYYLYLLLSKVKPINTPLDLKTAIESLRFAANQSGEYATEAAFRLAFLYGSQFSRRPTSKRDKFVDLNDLIWTSEEYTPREVSAKIKDWLVLAALGDSHSISNIIEHYDEYTKVEVSPHTKAFFEERLKNNNSYVKESFCDAFFLITENMAKYGWMNLKDTDEIDIYSLFMRIAAKCKYGQEDYPSFKKMYAEVKNRFIEFAEAGHLYANYFLGFVAAHRMPPFAHEDREESAVWCRRIANLITPEELMRWVEGMITNRTETQHEPDIKRLRK